MSDSTIGLIVDQVTVEIEQGKIREFARATFTQDPVHTSSQIARKAGFGAAPATATHLVVTGHLRDQQGFVDRLGLALERVVVGGVRWEYLRPLVAGDRVTATRTVVGDVIRPGKRGGTMRIVTLETAFVDGAGDTVARQRDTIIEREATG